MINIKRSFIILCCIMLSAVVDAYDFEVDGVCYNITSVSEKTVEVTYKAYYMPTPSENTNYYKGEIKIPSSVEYNGQAYTVSSIGKYAFARTTNLTSISLPNTLTSIGDASFYMASGLEQIIIPESVTSIGEGAFMYCKKLKRYSLPNKIHAYSDSQFSYCTELDTLKFSSSVSQLGYCCYQGCTNLKAIYFDSNISFSSFNSYGCLTFKQCSNIESIYCKSTSPKGFSNNNVFDSNIYLNATLYVPVGSSSLYKASNGWKEFVNIVETDDMNTYYGFNISTSSGGTVFALDNTLSNTSLSVSVKEGDNVTITFTPNEGYEFKSLIVNGEDLTNSVSNNSYTISSVSQNTSIVVSFAELPVYLTIKSADNGSIAQELERGKTSTFVIYPSEGWQVESVSFNGADVTSLMDGSKYTTPAITANSELNIVYKQEGSTSAKSFRLNNNINVSASYGTLNIQNNGGDTSVSVYFTNGARVVYENIGVGTTTFNLPINNTYIVKVGYETYKVSM